MRRPIPPPVQTLVQEHIHSLEQLEVLLYMRTSAPRSLTAEGVARELRIAPDSAAERLRDLHARAFLRHEADGSYAYAPSPEARATLELLATTYAEQRVSLIELVFSKPLDTVRTFADAFKFRKDS